MKVEIKKPIKETLNVLKCAGATCVSINSRWKRYYATDLITKKLKMKKYKYAVS